MSMAGDCCVKKARSDWSRIPANVQVSSVNKLSKINLRFKPKQNKVMKFCTNTSCWLMPHVKKFLLVMKLATFLILLSMMQVSASSFAQKITLSKRSVTLEQLFNEITKQTGYSVFYADSKLDQNHKLTVDFRNTPLENVLEQSFKNLELSYSIKDRNILVKKKEPSFLEKVIERFQRIDVRGRVVDGKNQPLSGATINVKNSVQGAKTDARGNFFLSGIEEKSTLVISYIGFKTREITAKSDLEVLVLELQDNSLEQVQVIAYGEIQKKYSTSNQATIKSKDIQNQPVGNIQLALAGRVPGMFIKQGSGLSSSQVDITIQGRNSLGNGNTPFYVVDGIPYSSNFTGVSLMGGAISGAPNAFNFINPADIESVTILKVC